ncbi:zinc finger protein 277 [Clupea harengus]|uniref:Zinc finger protein 277 n=1 Tax=Clupea harengus TaxID=7950 RepID=A0A8M1KJM2_CLUHA|nr:zinc finger protein 277 [Clupea harengus]
MATSLGENSAGYQDCILESLSFPEQLVSTSSYEANKNVTCILCSKSTPLSEKNELLKHLVLEHKVVIADVRLIADFSRYLLYWGKRFSESPITEFCSVIKTNSTGPVDQQEEYYLLCDALPEDRILREQLQQKRLEEVLEQQQKERDDCTFHRICMFCDEEFTENRSTLLNHMAREHSFSVGLPDNIVYCTELLDTLERKLDNLQCLYCEKTFRDKTTLKDHMRKKQHRRINANNHDYDRFYIINYLELGKTWEEVQSEDDRDILADNDDDWSDWQAHPVCAVCLFCEQQSDTMEKIYAHMQEAHGFDLHQLKTQLNLTFYQQIKLVNFIRREIHQCRCYSCHEKFSSKADVLHHVTDAGHVMALPDTSTWDQPEYYFPTYENDALLCALTDSEDEEEADQRGGVPVIAEDISNLETLKQSSVLKHLLKDRSGPC